MKEILNLYCVSAFKTFAQLIKAGAVSVFYYIIRRQDKTPWNYKPKK